MSLSLSAVPRGLQDEHSHVDVAVRRRIGEIILEIENEELTETARRLVEQLPPEDVAQLVADWLGRADGDLAVRLRVRSLGSVDRVTVISAHMRWACDDSVTSQPMK